MAKPKPQLGLDSAHISDEAAGIADEHWSWCFFEHIYCSFDDAQFADLYQEGVAVADLDFSLIEQWSTAAAPYLKDYLEKEIPEVQDGVAECLSPDHVLRREPTCARQCVSR